MAAVFKDEAEDVWFWSISDGVLGFKDPYDHWAFYIDPALVEAKHIRELPYLFQLSLINLTGYPLQERFIERWKDCMAPFTLIH